MGVALREIESDVTDIGRTTPNVCDANAFPLPGVIVSAALGDIQIPLKRDNDFVSITEVVQNAEHEPRDTEHQANNCNSFSDSHLRDQEISAVCRTRNPRPYHWRAG